MSGLATSNPATAEALAAIEAIIPQTLGADLLGTLFGLILYGLSVHQLYRYFRLFPTDAIFIRILVALVMTFETVHAVLTMHFCYDFLVTNYLNPEALVNGVWSLDVRKVNPCLAILHTNYAFHVALGNSNRSERNCALIAALLCPSSVFEWPAFPSIRYFRGFSIVITIKTFSHDLNDLGHEKWLISATLGAPLAADLVFSVTLLTVLRASRQCQKKACESKLDWFVIYIVNTGLLHCTVNVVALAVNLASMNGESTYYLLFNIIAARLYANSLLSALNSREARPGNISFDGSIGLNFIERATRRAAAETWNVPQVPEGPPSMINIKMTTELETDNDHELHWDQKTLEGGAHNIASVNSHATDSAV
uniref:UDP-xylose synthase n=1 Tax=Ganoderma boninense TaxID=34458 RepID=A0A5K1K1M4_9APHY|nr:UDP-xylose synthase [Ganoderma boninense]